MNLSDDYINGNLIEEFSMNVNPIIKQGRSADPKWSSYSFNKFNDYVKKKNARLPTVEEVRVIIKNDQIKPNGDIWMPAYNNGRPDWVQVSDGRKGRSHLDYYGNASWGNKTSSYPWRGKTLVYIPNNDYKIVIGNHPEKSRSYSSIWGNNAIGTGHAQSTINSPVAWCMNSQDRDYNKGRWMIIDMGEIKDVAGVIIQGRARGKYSNQFVKKLDVYVSKQKDRGYVKKLDNVTAITGINQTKQLHFLKKTSARYIKLVPRNWFGHPSIRVDALLYIDNNIENRKSERKNIIKKSEVIINVTDTRTKAIKKGKELTKKYANMGETVKNMKRDAGKYANELIDYKKKSTNWKVNNINKQINILNKDRDIKRNYFDTLYNFHKDQSRDIILDNDSVHTRKNILDRREDQIETNTQHLIDLNNDLDTNIRQHRIGVERLYSDKKGFVFNLIMMVVLFLVIAIIILKKYNKVTDIQIHYILFIVGAIIIGLVFIRENNNRNRNYLNYQDKLF